MRYAPRILYGAVPAAMFLAISAAAIGQATRAASGPSTEQPAAPTTVPSPADRLAGDSLRHCAVVQWLSTGSGRGGRMVVLSRFAYRLAPGDPQTSALMAEIASLQDSPAGEAAALKVYLQSHPEDYAVGVRWLLGARATLQNAKQRVDFLQSVTADPKLPAPLRAVAASMWADVLVGQGDKTSAAAALDKALELDPHQPSALNTRMSLLDSPAPARQIGAALDSLGGGPNNASTLVLLAGELNGLGLYEQSLTVNQVVWALLKAHAAQDKPVAGPILAQYCSAMIDADPAKAIETFGPLLNKYPDSTDLHALMVEAYRLKGLTAQADDLAGAMEAVYKGRFDEKNKPLPPAGALELASFYLLVKPDARMALAYARQGAKDAPEELVQTARRLLGQAELASDMPAIRAEGLKVLTALAPKDAYAAASVGEYLLAAGQTDEAKTIIQAAGDLARGGPAWRRLSQVAAKANVKFTAPKEADQAAKAFKDFDLRYFEMAVAPQKFMSIAIKPVAPSCVVGQELLLEVTLTNTGPLPLPLGEQGLVRPSGWLIVKVGGATEALPPLPVSLPAPRYLAAGASVSTVARLDDLPALAQALAARPLDDLDITVEMVLDPKGDRTSSAPTVKIAPASMTRAGLLGAFDRSADGEWVKAYKLALGTIVRDMKRGELPQRVLAARQTGALLTLACLVDKTKASPPAPLAKEFAEPVLLAMLRELLKNDSAMVRAEALAALDGCELDDSILALLPPAIADPDPLVRLRVAELLGFTAKGQDAVLKALAKDSDELVSLMAISAMKK